MARRPGLATLALRSGSRHTDQRYRGLPLLPTALHLDTRKTPLCHARRVRVSLGLCHRWLRPASRSSICHPYLATTYSNPWTTTAHSGANAHAGAAADSVHCYTDAVAISHAAIPHATNRCTNSASDRSAHDTALLVSIRALFSGQRTARLVGKLACLGRAMSWIIAYERNHL